MGGYIFLAILLGVILLLSWDPYTKHCIDCGKDCSATSYFCSDCGKKAAQNKCTCGKYFEPKIDKFCVRCGKELIANKKKSEPDPPDHIDYLA